MKIVRETRPDGQYLARLADEYANAKAFAEKATARADELKSELARVTDELGQQDNKGNIWLQAGKYDLKRERRLSRSLDLSHAETWARDNGVWGEVSEIKAVLSEDLLLGWAWDHPDKTDEVQALYKEKEVWAFKLSEAKVPLTETSATDVGGQP
jgi:hypothetical protein